jgi:hypothetical protein
VSYEWEIKGVTCKGAWLCEDTLKAPYEDTSYHDTFEKLVKLLDGGEKGVIVVRGVFSTSL